MMRCWTVAVVLLLAACPKGGGDETQSEATGGTAMTGGTGTSSEGSTGGQLTTGEPQGPPSYCPGVPERSEPVCREDADCEGFASCVAVADDCPGPGCGGDCSSDEECVEEGFPPRVCVFPNGGCCASSGTCADLCTPGSCAADESCEADGHCVPLSCEGEFTCPEGQKCEPGTGADRHGCRGIPCGEPGALECPVVAECLAGVCTSRLCSVDADCPCGTCIQGGCWDRPWICDEGNR